MSKIKNDFNPSYPYRVIEVDNGECIKYKIQQPVRLFVFGFTKKYFDVRSWYLREKHGATLYFEDKKKVDEFINLIKPDTKPTFTIVFDSLKDK